MFVLFALLVPGMGEAASIDQKPLRIAFLYPDSEGGSAFWNEVVEVMQAAAKDLDVSFQVVNAPNAYSGFTKAKALLAGGEAPDGLVMMYQARYSREIMELAEKMQVATFLINTDIITEDRKAVGRPRGRLKTWVGHMLPDDERVGADLARALFRIARTKGEIPPDGKFTVLALGGSGDSTSSLFRNQGLKRALADEPQAVLGRLVPTDWEFEEAAKKTATLLELYPDAKVFWAASDELGLGILQAADSARPPRRVITGGIDWTPQGLDAVRQGRLAVSYGGHFMEGAWAMVLLYDYLRGNDFKDEGLVWRTPMVALQKGQSPQLWRFLARRDWDSIDFHRFSKTYTPALERYDFSMDTVLENWSH